MQDQEPLQHQESTHTESPVQGTTPSSTTTDPINRLADILVGMNNRPSTQLLMVRPLSSTTLTFDEK